MESDRCVPCEIKDSQIARDTLPHKASGTAWKGGEGSSHVPTDLTRRRFELGATLLSVCNRLTLPSITTYSAMVTLGDSLEITQLATQCLPLELVLRIIELLVLDLRDHEPQRARLLSSISRTVRTGILPLVYEIVAFRIRDRQRVPAGWDGRSYEHPTTGL